MKNARQRRSQIHTLAVASDVDTAVDDTGDAAEDGDAELPAADDAEADPKVRDAGRIYGSESHLFAVAKKNAL